MPFLATLLLIVSSAASADTVAIKRYAVPVFAGFSVECPEGMKDCLSENSKSAFTMVPVARQLNVILDYVAEGKHYEGIQEVQGVIGDTRLFGAVKIVYNPNEERMPFYSVVVISNGKTTMQSIIRVNGLSQLVNGVYSFDVPLNNKKVAKVGFQAWGYQGVLEMQPAPVH